MIHVLAYDCIKREAMDKHSVSDMTVEGDSTKALEIVSFLSRSSSPSVEMTSYLSPFDVVS